jgi:hypothetical protein
LVELAVLADTTPSTISKLERSEVSLSLDWMVKLAPHLNVSPIELMADPSVITSIPPPLNQKIELSQQYELQVNVAVFKAAVANAYKFMLDVAEHVEFPPDRSSEILSGAVAHLAWACLEIGSSEIPLDDQRKIRAIMSAIFPTKRRSEREVEEVKPRSVSGGQAA